MRHRILCLLPAMAVAAAAHGPAMAAEARTGVHAEHGEIVLLRDVNARHAYRSVPPSVATIVDPRPNREIAYVLGAGELGDDDFAALASGQGMTAPGGGTGVERMTTTTLGAALGTGPVGGQAGQGQLSGGALGGTLGAVGTTTRGISDQVRGALSQFPLGQTPGGNPGGGP